MLVLPSFGDVEFEVVAFTLLGEGHQFIMVAGNRLPQLIARRGEVPFQVGSRLVQVLLIFRKLFVVEGQFVLDLFPAGIIRRLMLNDDVLRPVDLRLCHDWFGYD